MNTMNLKTSSHLLRFVVVVDDDVDVLVVVVVVVVVLASKSNDGFSCELLELNKNESNFTQETTSIHEQITIILLTALALTQQVELLDSRVTTVQNKQIALTIEAERRRIVQLVCRRP